jgi:N-acetylmuramoyl-L-alanine amidase
VGRGLVVALLAVVWTPAAHACPVQATPAAGAAPLTVTYTAACESSAFHWSFADGGGADGTTVTHVFAPGRFGGTLTTDAEETPLPQVTSIGFTLKAPAAADWGSAVVFSGSVKPARRVRLYRGDSFVASAEGPRFRLHVRLLGPGPYTLRAPGAVSAPVTVRVRPTIETRLVGTGAVGRSLTLVARLRPARAGTLQVKVGKTSRHGDTIRLRLDTHRARSLRVAIRSLPAAGYAAERRALSVPVVYPDLEPGSTGPSVLELERRLAELRYALLGVDAAYGEDTVDAVTAFQKVEGLPRTGRADAALWTRLAQARTPRPVYGGGDHVEVDKTRQVLFLVRGGAVTSIVPVSTAGIAGYYTPEGRFAVYRKVPGLDLGPLGALYDPNYFTGGYAIHGSPSVPPYPASHGCVRVPMWISWRLYSTIPYGEPVFVYS